ncbi:RNA polymerase sigma factor [Polyangium aurulentum]|uniref:RNA polymerase sigma factor n=1 Tax=Polyangium aurulentum TaxID=2567896 RepID=UPI00200DBC33|nr:sigma-70 family RNA polymerase sigma factor [Polyangium aurulentum]UQA58572.1 sigma-70 family RNA polymerase sigma factor [Polyangium aurulentum]
MTTPEAFIGALYANFGKPVRRKLRRAGVARADVEDLCQAVFLVALRRQRRVPTGHTDARRWLLDTARKIARNYHRLYYRQYEVSDDDALERAIAEPQDPEAALASRILVHRSGQRLGASDREILASYHVEGDCLVSIASMLGISKSGAYVRLVQAERRLAMTTDAHPGR